MGERTIKMPDIGEGVAEAELVSWLVRVGDAVREDQPLAEVMTDKATVEIPSPADGIVAWLGPAVGDKVAIGAPFIRLTGATVGEESGAETALADRPTSGVTDTDSVPSTQQPAALAAPAVRARAKALGIDIASVMGTGPNGRVTDADLDAYVDRGQPGVELVRVIGMRRVIADKMTLAASRIPHITYVEEVDVTALEEVRASRNALPGSTKLTILPFLVRAIVRAVGEMPDFNAHFDDDAGILRRFRSVHVGVATQTAEGLKVPVLQNAQQLDLDECAQAIARLANAARDGSASRADLTGSTITITSLGALGGLVTTPIINHPEVAIVGVNKIKIAPIWDGDAFVPRKIMNVSASFDHRIIDGWNAATFVQALRAALESPELLAA